MSKFNILYKQILDEFNQFKSLQIITKNNIPIINQSIIQQNIFSNQLFQKFFNQIQKNNQFQYYTKQQFKLFFPPNWKHLKQINKSKKRGELFIFKIKYEKIEIQKIIIKLLNYLGQALAENNLIEFINAISEQVLLTGNSATFISLKDINDFAIIFINSNNYSIKEVKHEFGHYYQWLTRG